MPFSFSYTVLSVSGKAVCWKTMPLHQFIDDIPPPAARACESTIFTRSSKLYSMTSCTTSFFHGSIVTSNRDVLQQQKYKPN